MADLIATAAGPKPAAPARLPARIVVADDQPDVRIALRLLLKSEGHEVEAVGSPAALLETAGRGADLVLMDLNYTRDTTSGAEGLGLLQRLRERHPSLPVLVMTAWGSIELAVSAMRRGARGFVLKPWDNGTLQRLVAAELAEAARRAAPSVAGATRDLAVASRVQAELLPRTKPSLATLDYDGLCLQAGAVGGDLYDFLPLGAGRVAFVLDARAGGRPMPLLAEGGTTSALLPGPGPFALQFEWAAPVSAEPGRASVTLSAPRAGSVRAQLDLPGAESDARVEGGQGPAEAGQTAPSANVFALQRRVARRDKRTDDSDHS
jgi:FixJ family two-component response regulator